MKVTMPHWECDEDLKKFIKSEAKKLGMTMTGYNRHVLLKEKEKVERKERRKAK